MSGLPARIAFILPLLLFATAVPRWTHAATGAPVVNVARLDGVVGPAEARYIARVLDQSARQHAQAVVIEMDTPGGLMKSMDDIAKALLSSPVPTVVYVYPTGARAASAGVFITYAAHLAAMAPTTHLGAAHPVGIGSSGGIDKTEMTKITNDAAAEIRGFAIRNGRNPIWAEQAVRQSVSITEQQALRLGVINVVVSTPQELLVKIDGRNVRTATGLHRLATRNAVIVEAPMDLAERFLLLLGDPNVAFILMTIGIYGLIFELSNPGSIFPGVIGGVALILSLVLFTAIDVNVGGLFLIAFAIVLFIADLKVPSHGILTAGGIASFVLGSLLLTHNQAPFLQISLVLILAIAALTAAFFMFAVGAGIRAQGRRVQTGLDALIGAQGIARRDLAPAGPVFVQGELWNAESIEGNVKAGDQVRVVGVSGLRLSVRRSGDASNPEERT